MQPDTLRYRATHEWIEASGAERRVGISSFAQEQLGDIVFVELPTDLPRDVAAGDEVLVIESCKATSSVYAPLAGRVTGVNQRLADHPERINQDPTGEGWLFTLEVAPGADESELLDAESYRRLCEAEG
ncbi:MAG: Glycine cleavage system H protein [candidate division BRC1 bacterium ADurb.BinA292]|nr:MAG: Glycine cleavage system H protein [candidate division BRC1 bacterium ADurb.BinA292]